MYFKDSNDQLCTPQSQITVTPRSKGKALRQNIPAPTSLIKRTVTSSRMTSYIYQNTFHLGIT
jgi:hypothetical protein